MVHPLSNSTTYSRSLSRKKKETITVYNNQGLDQVVVPPHPRFHLVASNPLAADRTPSCAGRPFEKGAVGPDRTCQPCFNQRQVR